MVTCWKRYRLLNARTAQILGQWTAYDCGGWVSGSVLAIVWGCCVNGLAELERHSPVGARALDDDDECDGWEGSRGIRILDSGITSVAITTGTSCLFSRCLMSGGRAG